MHRYQLFTRTGAFVDEVAVPDPYLPFDILQWRNRMFVLKAGRFVEATIVFAQEAPPQEAA